MGVFYILLLVPMVIQHIAIKGLYVDYEKRNRIALTFYFVLLTLLVMLRHEGVGTDTRNYIYYFKKYSRMDWQILQREAIEIGFSYFNKIISLFSDEPQFFLAMAALLVSILMYPTYRRLCVDASLTVVLFSIMSIFVMMFSGIRQMLSIGIGFVAYKYTRSKKLIPFLLSVLLAMSAHTSAFMLIFMYPLYHAKITKKWLYVVVPVLAIIFVFNSQIFSVLTALMAQYTKYEGGITSTGAYTMLILFVIFTVFSFVIPDESRVDEEMIGLRNFLLLSMIIQMFAPLHALAMRMNYYYIVFIPLLIPKVVECRSRRWNQVAMAGRHIMVIFFFLYFFYNANVGRNLDVFPYRFFWENLG
jgi:hypothetical protein